MGAFAASSSRDRPTLCAGGGNVCLLNIFCELPFFSCGEAAGHTSPGAGLFLFVASERNSVIIKKDGISVKFMPLRLEVNHNSILKGK